MMDRRSGGCCIARCSSAGGGVYDIANKVNRIMLRFRPIAPKPSAGGESAANTEIYSKPAAAGTGRGKRRRSPNKNNISSSNRNCREISKRCNRKKRVENDVMMMSSTLSLLPNTPVFDHHVSSHNPNKQLMGFDHGVPVVVTPPHALVVTVECVTETWLDGNNCLGRTEEERRSNLAKDTCPGFVSDGFESVTWTNAAFREMVGGSGNAVAEMGTVLLVMKDRPVLIYPAFTCRVRVESSVKEKRSAVTLPCDVWKMNGNGWAWRLDLTAALRLGPPW